MGVRLRAPMMPQPMLSGADCAACSNWFTSIRGRLIRISSAIADGLVIGHEQTGAARARYGLAEDFDPYLESCLVTACERSSEFLPYRRCRQSAGGTQSTVHRMQEFHVHVAHHDIRATT